ncbi:MAG TPA: endonuclease domain-containing protein [Saprospiraceae bacterium]|nr:endonuclease domain-containing protein [Saprospiraceae bacterium]
MCKKLRNNPTRAEEKMWSYLRNHRLKEKFRRQYPMWIYVADFYCHYLLLVIEIDGEVHFEEEVQEKDEVKEKDIRSLGVDVIRFTNHEVLNDIDSVMSRLYSKIVEIKNERFKPGKKKEQDIVVPPVP